MGALGLRKTSKRVKQRDPNGLKHPVPKCFSDYQFHLGVEPFDDARGVLLLGAKVVEDQVARGLQHPRLRLHRCDAATDGHVAPSVEELPCPEGRDVRPEVVEVLLEDVRARGAEVQPKESAEPTGLLLGQVARALEQAPARVLERHLVAVPAQLGGVLPTGFVDRLVEVSDDVKLVEDVERLAGAVPNHVEVGLPHVAAHDAQRL